ncbi:MAG: oligosaccharide flippase family protein [Nanoarchaeota archaeon]
MFKEFFSRKDSLVRDNFILVTASMFGNVAAFLFHIFMVRFLGSVDYGILGVLLSIIYLIAVPLLVIQTVIAKFISQYKAKGEHNKINLLLRRSSIKFIKYSAVFFIISLLLIPFLSKFLYIPKLNFLVLSPIIFLATLIPIGRGALQGLQEFKILGYNIITEAFLKLIFGVFLVFLGLAVNGAILAIILSFIFPLILLYYKLKKYLENKEQTSLNIKEIYSNSYAVLFTLLTLTLFYTIDLFLVKHYFSGIEAGLYATASLLGKIIYFASLAIVLVMFPKTTELFTVNKPSSTILIKSLVFILLIAIPVLLVYFLLPEYAILILGGREYLPISNLLGFFGLAMTFFTLSYTLAFYNLSINKSSFVYGLVILNIIETLAIYLFHSTIKEVVIILNIITLVSLLYLGGYTIKNINGKAINNNPSA